MEGPSPRVVKETKTIQSDPVPGIAFTPDPKNYKHFFIELQGTSLPIQHLQELATKAANSRLSCYSQTTIPCLPQKLSSTPRSTTLTSVLPFQFRQFRKDLPGHPQEELVTSPANEVSVAIDSKFIG